MPELPEVETMRRGIVSIEGSTIRNVVRPPCSCRPIEIKPRIDAFARRVKGKTVDHVGRIGKRVAVRLNNEDTIVFEPRMTGLVLVAVGIGVSPPPSPHEGILNVPTRVRQLPAEVL